MIPGQFLYGIFQIERGGETRLSGAFVYFFLKKPCDRSRKGYRPFFSVKIDISFEEIIKTSDEKMMYLYIFFYIYICKV